MDSHVTRQCLLDLYMTLCIIIPECPTLENLCNVLVDSPINPKPGDVATYDCLEGFELDGEETRTCQDDYTWDGSAPCCVIRPCKGML